MSATAIPRFSPQRLGDLVPLHEDLAVVRLEPLDEVLDLGLPERGIDRGVDLLLGLRPGAAGSLLGGRLGLAPSSPP